MWQLTVCPGGAETVHRLDTCIWRLQAGGWWLEGGGWRLEAGGWWVDSGGWRLVGRGWWVELEVVGSILGLGFP